MKNLRVAIVILLAMFISAVLIMADEQRLKVPPRLKVKQPATIEAKPPLPDEIKSDVKVKKAFYRSASSPRWNLSGSWSRVRDRNDLINHLANTHQYSRATLSQMSIQMLWALHDDDHEGRATLLKAIKTEEYCPPGGT